MSGWTGLRGGRGRELEAGQPKSPERGSGGEGCLSEKPHDCVGGHDCTYTCVCAHVLPWMCVCGRVFVKGICLCVR